MGIFLSPRPPVYIFSSLLLSSLSPSATHINNQQKLSKKEMGRNYQEMGGGMFQNQSQEGRWQYRQAGRLSGASSKHDHKNRIPPPIQNTKKQKGSTGTDKKHNEDGGHHGDHQHTNPTQRME